MASGGQCSCGRFGIDEKERIEEDRIAIMVTKREPAHHHVRGRINAWVAERGIKWCAGQSTRGGTDVWVPTAFLMSTADFPDGGSSSCELW